MSSGSERKFSVEELTALNRAAAAPPQSTTPTNHPTEQEWAQLLALQQEAAQQLSHVTWQLDRYPYPPNLKPMENRLELLGQELKALCRTAEKLEQAGRKKGRRSCRWLDWLPDFSLTVVVKWGALVLIIVGALLAMVNGVATVVGNIRSLLL